MKGVLQVSPHIDILPAVLVWAAQDTLLAAADLPAIAKTNAAKRKAARRIVVLQSCGGIDEERQTVRGAIGRRAGDQARLDQGAAHVGYGSDELRATCFKREKGAIGHADIISGDAALLTTLLTWSEATRSPHGLRGAWWGRTFSAQEHRHDTRPS